MHANPQTRFSFWIHTRCSTPDVRKVASTYGKVVVVDQNPRDSITAIFFSSFSSQRIDQMVMGSDIDGRVRVAFPFNGSPGVHTFTMECHWTE